MTSVWEVEPFQETSEGIVSLTNLAESWSGEFWSTADIFRAIRRPSGKAFLGKQSCANVSQGFLLADVGKYQAELLYIYVSPEKRKSGLGKVMMKVFLDTISNDTTLEAVFLEVRKGNQGAQLLYGSLGFDCIDVRSGYYSDGEDALIYKKIIKDSVDES